MSKNVTKRHGRQAGFTLIELMITLTILAIMMSLAAPAFTKMIRDNRVQTASTSLMSAFNLTRAEAIRRGRTVKICATDDPSGTPPACGADWALGWVMFTDLNGNDDAGDTVTLNGNSVAEEVIRVGDPVANVTIDDSGAASIVSFDSRGMVNAGSGDFVFDAVDCNSGVDKQYTVQLGAVGRTRSEEGTCPP